MTIPAVRFRHNRELVLVLLAGLVGPVNVSAQEAVVPLQFSFSDPGARSMGFGGAFVALADDATAAFANPAGLTQLIRPEISIEARYRNYATPYTESGRVENLPSGYGIDTQEGLATAKSDDILSNIAYLSFVYPKKNWSFAAYRHDLADFEFFSETQGLFGGGTDCCQIRDFDQRSGTDLEITGYGLSAAYRVSDKLDLGLGVVFNVADYASDTTLFRPDDDTIEAIFALNSYLPERSALREEIIIDDSDWTITAGFLWRPAESWSIGGVYRQPSKLDLTVRLTAGQAVEPNLNPGDVLFTGTDEIEMPALYGLGFAYRPPGSQFTLTFQWDRVEYSNIVDSLRLDDRAMDDVDELHLGAEYVFLNATPIVAVRAGVWMEPDHQMRATSDSPFVAALLPRGDDDIHYSAGIGFASEYFQIDLALDFADLIDTVSLSAIYSF